MPAHTNARLICSSCGCFVECVHPRLLEAFEHTSYRDVSIGCRSGFCSFVYIACLHWTLRFSCLLRVLCCMLYVVSALCLLCLMCIVCLQCRTYLMRLLCRARSGLPPRGTDFSLELQSIVCRECTREEQLIPHSWSANPAPKSSTRMIAFDFKRTPEPCLALFCWCVNYAPYPDEQL